MNPDSKILHLWIPGALFIALIAAELFLPGRFIAFVVAENGPLEIGQFVILCAAFLYALSCLKNTDFKTARGLALWFGLAALGCFYTGGEEISWGQQFFKWATPDSWLVVNDQQETNLHNTTSWLDQKPRLVLEIGVIAGGLILPLLMRFRENLIPGWLKTIAPPPRLALIAGVVLIVKIFDKIGDVSDFVLFKRGSEIIEIYIYYFILLYLAAMRARQKA